MKPKLLTGAAAVFFCPKVERSTHSLSESNNAWPFTEISDEEGPDISCDFLHDGVAGQFDQIPHHSPEEFYTI